MVKAPGIDEIPEPSLQDWLGFLGMVVGMFMAVLDIQIVASSITQIQGGISASADEVNWVQSAYLIAEVIIIPLTGWLARTFSTRYLFLASCIGFTIMSFVCAFAWSIESMIIFRALQGFFGGALIPSVFSVVYTLFPKRLQALLTIVIGSVVTIAPTAGPVIGGYLTEVFSWHALFLINVVPGILVCVSTYLFVHVDEPNLKLLKQIDFIGIILIAISLGSLQYVLEEGVREGWFESELIINFTIISILSGILMFYRELTIENPIIDLRAFRNRNFAFGSLFSFVLGSGLYVSVYLIPLQLSIIKGLNSLEIGIYVAVTGMFQFLSAPIAAALSKKMDLRIILAMGITLFGMSGFLNSHQSNEAGYWELFFPQAVRGLSMMLCFLPINTIALGTLKISEVKNASGLYNLTRNLGGAIGLAVFNTFLTNWRKANYAIFRENITPTNQTAQNTLSGITEHLSEFSLIPDAELSSLKLLTNIAQREAYVTTFNQLFFVIGIMFFIMLLIIPFLNKVQPTAANNLKDVH